MTWPNARKSEVTVFEARCDECQIGKPDLFVDHAGALLAITAHSIAIRQTPLHSASARLSIVRHHVLIWEVGEQ